jgi:hypothetical protein
VAIRATGSIIVLVSCGYERESMAHMRSLVEAVIRGREMSEDASGDKARRILKGQRRRP